MKTVPINKVLIHLAKNDITDRIFTAATGHPVSQIRSICQSAKLMFGSVDGFDLENPDNVNMVNGLMQAGIITAPEKTGILNLSSDIVGSWEFRYEVINDSPSNHVLGTATWKNLVGDVVSLRDWVNLNDSNSRTDFINRAKANLTNFQASRTGYEENKQLMENDLNT